MLIEKLKLSTRAYNCLKRAHIDTVEQVIDMSDEELMKIRNIGVSLLKEIRQSIILQNGGVPMNQNHNCPNFECLDCQSDECAKHYGCEGCDKYCSCDFCANSSILVDNVIIPCDMKNLPIPCRFCKARNSPYFSIEVNCVGCTGRNLTTKT